MEMPLRTSGGARVELRGGFVEYHHCRVETHEPCEGELLGARRGHRMMPKADQSVDAFRERVGPGERVDRAECRTHVVITRIGRPSRTFSVTPVRTRGLLCDHRNYASPRVRPELVNRVHCHLHVAAARVQEPRDDLAECRLAPLARRLPSVAGWNVEADAVDTSVPASYPNTTSSTPRRPQWPSDPGLRRRLDGPPEVA
jgi:hypothetical protein